MEGDAKRAWSGAHFFSEWPLFLRIGEGRSWFAIPRRVEQAGAIADAAGDDVLHCEADGGGIVIGGVRVSVARDLHAEKAATGGGYADRAESVTRMRHG